MIVVDLQGDFTTWKNGTLAVTGTDEAYVKKVAEATALFKKEGVAIYGTQDWHPANHISFAVNHVGKKPFEVIQVNGQDPGAVAVALRPGDRWRQGAPRQ